MTSRAVRRLDEVDRLAVQQGDLPPQLVARVRTANEAAVQHAATRLRARLGDRVVAALAAPCTEPALGTAKGDTAALPCGRAQYEWWLTAEPRLVANATTGANADMEFRDAKGKLPGERFGNRLEPDSDTFQMDIHRVRRALTEGITLGIRQFDRCIPSLAELVDDIIAVSGADVFTKLFVSAGSTSITGWHSDRQDVIAFMLWGSKRFQLGDWDTPEGGPPSQVVLDEVLHEGDCLLFPEGHPHQAVPLGEDSGLLSIALLRRHNWISRDQVPIHLGAAEFPPSDEAYRKLLRARTGPSAEPVPSTKVGRVRSLIPGGVELLGSASSGEIVFAAAGGVFGASTQAVALLADLHADSPTTVHAAKSDPAERADSTIAASLIEAGLIACVP
ncbi:JmjC domain-containing protein [Kitasatospora sp. NPDC088548]|uniref:JmjC domain-containing protein n=1 Tax=Kitasatospora sp. NPDC088548 TaxID=3364075 RepID=UPI0037F3ACCC